MQQTNTDLKLRTLKHETVSWVDVESPDKEALSKLEHDYQLHPVHVKESLQKVQHTQVEREDQYLFFVLHVPVTSGKTGRIIINQVGVFLGKHYLVTIRTGSCPSITNIFDACEHDEAKRELYFKHGSAYLLYALINQVLDDMSRMAEAVVTELDEIEDLVFDTSGSDAQRIGKLRQKIVRLRRVIGPKRIILQDLAEQVDTFVRHGLSMGKYYSNNTKKVNKLWEVVEEAKETVEIYKDADFTTSTEKTNRILAILTLIFTFTIPVTVLGAVYGMNVLLPGGIETGAWTFLGKYTTLIIIATVSACVALGMFVYFKAKKWM